MNVENGEILYHGSYCEIEKPDLKKCRYGKDFGKGFYLTTSKEQAVCFTRTSLIKAQKDGITIDGALGVVNSYKYNKGSDINEFRFQDANREWLHCVAGYRKSNSGITTMRWDDYDVVIGKIANDRTNMVITAYLDGIYGKVGSDRADEMAISLLEPDNLRDQLCFRTARAIDALTYIGCEEVAHG